MPALNFQERFSPLLENGTKTTTIRKKRKRPLRKGDKFYLYTGMRTKNCRKIKEVICESVSDFTISDKYKKSCIRRDKIDDYCHRVCIVDSSIVRLNGLVAPVKELEEIAIQDGFKDAKSFLLFFDDLYGSSFQGNLIRWK